MDTIIKIDARDLYVESNNIPPERTEIECKTGALTFSIKESTVVTLEIKTYEGLRQAAIMLFDSTEQFYQVMFPDFMDVPKGIILETALANLAQHSLDTIIKVALAKITTLRLYLNEKGDIMTFEILTPSKVSYGRFSVVIEKHYALMRYFDFKKR